LHSKDPSVDKFPEHFPDNVHDAEDLENFKFHNYELETNADEKPGK